MKDGFKSATIIATLNLLSWKKGLQNLVSGYSDNGLNYSLFDWSTTLCVAKWKDFDSTFAPGAVS